MAPLAICLGVLLGALGPLLYVLSDPAKQSLTAFIPTGFGVAFILCGVIAFNDQYRKHVMHVAAVLALVGSIAPLVMVMMAMLRGNEFEEVRHGGQMTMSGLCLVFLVLCIKSFIDARKARKAKEAEMQGS